MLYVSFSNDVFVPYQHVDIISGSLPHAGDIVEAASLAVSVKNEVYWCAAQANKIIAVMATVCINVYANCLLVVSIRID